MGYGEELLKADFVALVLDEPDLLAEVAVGEDLELVEEDEEGALDPEAAVLVDDFLEEPDVALLDGLAELGVLEELVCADELVGGELAEEDVDGD